MSHNSDINNKTQLHGDMSPALTTYCTCVTSIDYVLYTCHQHWLHAVHVSPAVTTYCTRVTSSDYVLYTCHQHWLRTVHVSPAVTTHCTRVTSSDYVLYTCHQQWLRSTYCTCVTSIDYLLYMCDQQRLRTVHVSPAVTTYCTVSYVHTNWLSNAEHRHITGTHTDSPMTAVDVQVNRTFVWHFILSMTHL